MSFVYCWYRYVDLLPGRNKNVEYRPVKACRMAFESYQLGILKILG